MSVQTLYFTRESLASYYAETPDPSLINPPAGQKLLVSWAIPRYYLEYEDLHLNMRIRFRNREEVEINFPIVKACDYYMYILANEHYFETGGILTYKVVLMSGDSILEEWRHQLWHELIKIGQAGATRSCTPGRGALPLCRVQGGALVMLSERY